MATITLPELSTVTGFATNKPIADATLPNKAVSLVASSDLDETVGSIRFSGSATASAQLAVINSKDDEDPTGLLQLLDPAPDDDEFDGAVRATHIPFDADKAYIALVGVSAGLKATAGASLADEGFDLSGEASALLGYLRSFDRDTQIYAAIAEAAANYRTFLNVEDVKSLSDGEAVTYALSGGLALALSVKLSDLAGELSAATQGVLSGTAGIKVTSGASVKFSIKIEDAFVLNATKAPRGLYRVAIRKGDTRSIGLGASIGITVALDEDSLLEALDALTQEYFGLPWKKIQDAAATATSTAMTPQQAAVVKKVLSQVGGGLDVADLEAFQKLAAKLQSSISGILSRKLSAKWRYNYSRVTENSAVLEVLMTAAALESLHGDLLRFNLEPVLSAAAAESGVTIEQYLGKKTDTVQIDYGFALSLGDFVVLAGTDSEAKTWVTLTDQDGRRKAAFLGRRGYQTNWLGRSTNLVTEFEASMAEYSAADPIRAADFELGFGVTFSWDKISFSDDVILDIADHGAVVAAVDPAAMSAVLAALRNDHGLGAKTKGSAVVHIQASNDLVLQLLPVLAGPDGAALLATALGQALSYMPDDAYRIRQSVTARGDAYAPVWLAFQQDDAVGPDDIARMCRSALAGSNVLANAEYQFLNGANWQWSAAGVVKREDALHDQIKGLQLAFAQLASRMQTGAMQKQIGVAFDEMSRFWMSSFPARAFAALLVQAALRSPKGIERLERRMEFSWVENGEDVKVAFARGAA